MGAAVLTLRGVSSRLGAPILPRVGLLPIASLLPVASLLPIALLLTISLMLPIALLPVATLSTIAWLVAVALLRVWLHGDICRALVRCRAGVRAAVKTYTWYGGNHCKRPVYTASPVHRILPLAFALNAQTGKISSLQSLWSPQSQEQRHVHLIHPAGAHAHKEEGCQATCCNRHDDYDDGCSDGPLHFQHLMMASNSTDTLKHSDGLVRAC